MVAGGEAGVVGFAAVRFKGLVAAEAAVGGVVVEEGLRVVFVNVKTFGLAIRSVGAAFVGPFGPI